MLKSDVIPRHYVHTIYVVLYVHLLQLISSNFLYLQKELTERRFVATSTTEVVVFQPNSVSIEPNHLQQSSLKTLDALFLEMSLKLSFMVLK